MLLDGMHQHANAEILGGGEVGRNRAEMLYRLKFDLPFDDLLDGTWPGPETEGVPAPQPPAPGTKPGPPHRSPAGSKSGSLEKPSARPNLG